MSIYFQKQWNTTGFVNEDSLAFDGSQESQAWFKIERLTNTAQIVFPEILADKLKQLSSNRKHITRNESCKQ